MWNVLSDKVGAKVEKKIWKHETPVGVVSRSAAYFDFFFLFIKKRGKSFSLEMLIAPLRALVYYTQKVSLFRLGRHIPALHCFYDCCCWCRPPVNVQKHSAGYLYY